MQSLWMLAAAALFSLMAVLVKFAARHYGILEIVFYRAAIGVVVLAAVARARGGSLASPVPWLHVRRGVVGTAALGLWFHAISSLPLGTAMTLNYTSPLFFAMALVVGALVAGRKPELALGATVAIGFAGVVLALRPNLAGAAGVPALCGLGSGALSAVAYWHVRALGQRGEPEWRTVFHFSVTGLVLGTVGSLVTGFSPLDLRGALLLAGVGLCATLAQLAMTRALARGRAMLAASLQYSAIVFASLLGVAVFDDRLPVSAWIGTGLIVVAGTAATLIASRRRDGSVVEAKAGAAAPAPVPLMLQPPARS